MADQAFLPAPRGLYWFVAQPLCEPVVAGFVEGCDDVGLGKGDVADDRDVGGCLPGNEVHGDLVHPLVGRRYG